MDSDYNLRTVFVSGEISNFTNHYRTGHFYMTLKDEKAAVRAVMFKYDNERLGFMPKNGMKVIARGRVSVFERDGQYQLYIEDMQPDGAGALSIAFEQLKKKLEAEGLFAQERKRPIPRFPKRVGVVTSPTGAAVRDIINVITRRSPSTQIILCPVQVQGASAAGQISDAIRRFNAGRYADVLIVGRGGGSVEELWAFNEEKVARAVAASDIPVISAVGHETDFTICDFAADLRAPTPSAAAELAVSDRAEQHAYINQLGRRCASALDSHIRFGCNVINRICGELSAYGPMQQIISQRQPLDSLFSDMQSAALQAHHRDKLNLSVLAGRLDALSPLRILSGGYAAVNLLIEGNESLAEEFGSVIDGFNQDRKCIDRSVTQEAHDFIEAHAELKAAKSTVIYNPRWMKGIVGIVASRLIETYYRPTVVLTMSNGFVTGSARSVPGFDLYQAIESCSDLLENFGGHMYAAGLTMRPERVEEFTRRFNAYVEENIDPITLQPQVEIDSELFFSNITPAFRRDLNRFQPFGPGNPAPVFVTRGVVSHGETKLGGADGEHLRMDLMQRQKPNTTIQTIAFQQPTHYEWIRAGHPIDVCYQIVENHYRGSVSVQLRIKDIKPLRGKQ